MRMLVYKYSGIMTVEMMFECCDKQFKNFRNKRESGTNLASKNFKDTVNPEPRL